MDIWIAIADIGWKISAAIAVITWAAQDVATAIATLGSDR